MEQETKNDRTLVSDARRGDTEAFGRLVDRYQGIVWAAAVSTVADPNLAEDIAQETFVAAWRSLDSLEEVDRLRPWLVGIARNTARNALRARRREVLVDDVEHRGQTGSPVDEAIAHEESRTLWGTLETIPEQYRVPLVLFYREEQSVQQVATDLGLTEAAVKKRLSRGRAMVRSGMERRLAAEAHSFQPRRALAPLVLAAIAVLPARQAAAASSGLTLFAKGLTMKGLAKAAAAIALLILLLLAGKSLLAGASSKQSAASKRGESSQSIGPIEPRFLRQASTAVPAPQPQDATLGGVVVDDEGAPIEGATVMFRIDPFQGTDSRHQPVTTSADGRFEIVSLHRDTPIHVSATAAGYLPTSRYDAIPEGVELRLVLRRGGLTLHGTVSDIGGGGIPGATVRYYHLSSGALAGADRPALATTTDDLGRYEVSLAPGKYIAAADHPDYAGELRATTLTLDGIAEDFILSPGAALEGVVRMRENGQPAPYATVHAMVMGEWDGNMIASIIVTGGQQRMFTATADARGRYRLDGLPAERLALSARAGAFVSPGVQHIDLGVADRRMDHTLWVQQGYRVSGTVVDATTGAPVAGIGVSATSNTSIGFGNDKPALTDADGNFETILPNGHFQLIAVGNGYQMSIDGPSVEVNNADVDGVRLEARKGATLRGTLDPPETGMLVLAPAGNDNGFDVSGFFSALLTQGRVADDGTFELVGAPEGTFRLVATTTSGRKGHVELTVNGDRDGIRIETGSDQSVEGMVEDTRGEPVAGASVRLVHPDAGDALGFDSMLDEFLAAGSRTDARGAFRIHFAAHGSFDVVVADRYGHPMQITTGQTVTLSGENRTQPIRLVVERNAGVLRGRVVSAGGSPVADALVRSPSLRSGALSDMNGEFEIAHVPPGHIALHARDAASGESGGVEQAEPGEYVTIRLQAPASLTVHVPGAVPGLMATVSSGDTDIGELTASGPDTWRIDRLAPGKYEVGVVGEPGGAGGQVTVAAGQQAVVSLTYRPWARLQGRVTKPDGAPASSVFFTMERDEDVSSVLVGHELYMLMRAKCDDEGYFDIAVAHGPGKLVIMGTDGVAQVAIEGQAGAIQDLGEIPLKAIR